MSGGPYRPDVHWVSPSPLWPLRRERTSAGQPPGAWGSAHSTADGRPQVPRGTITGRLGKDRRTPPGARRHRTLSPSPDSPRAPPSYLQPASSSSGACSNGRSCAAQRVRSPTGRCPISASWKSDPILSCKNDGTGPGLVSHPCPDACDQVSGSAALGPTW